MLRGTPTERRAIIARLEEALRQNPNSDIEATLNLLKDYAHIEKQLLYLAELHDEILLKITNGERCNEYVDGFLIEFRHIPELMSNHPEIQKIKFAHDKQSKVKNIKNYTEVNRDVTAYASKCQKCKNLKLNFRAWSKTGKWNVRCQDYCTDCYGICHDCGKDGEFKISGIRQCTLCAAAAAVLSSQIQQFAPQMSKAQKMQTAYLGSPKISKACCKICGNVLNQQTGKCLKCASKYVSCVTCKKMVLASSKIHNGECYVCYNKHYKAPAQQSQPVQPPSSQPVQKTFIQQFKNALLSLIR